MLEFIREAPGQRTALAALAERAFLQNGAAVHFASLLPKLYGQEACAQPVHTLLLENGTPAGLFALQVSEFQIAGMPLRVGWIGTVCVLPEFRGRGHLAHLMEEADRQLRVQGCALAVLGGQRQRYRRFGYELGGTQWQFTVTARNLRGLPEPEDASVRPLCEADIPQAFGLWKTQPVLGPRTPQTFLRILQSWGCEPLGVWNGGQLAGYAGCNAQGQMMELCVQSAALLPPLLWAYLARCTELTVMLGPWPGALQRALAGYAEHSVLTENHSYRALRWEPVVRAALALDRLSGQAPATCRLPIAGAGTLELQSGSCRFREDHSTQGISPTQAVQLLFGPASRLVLPAAGPSLPLPYMLPWLDGI